MTTITYHHTNLGSYAPVGHANRNGYIKIHVSARYAKASKEQLSDWLCSRSAVVRAAAATELAERDLAGWRR